MDIRQLARIDLNLLVALQVLLEERNVSRAAERLFVSQSAMSKTLGRLRELLDDPLFTRSSRGILPTPRAERLSQPLALLLEDVQSVVAPQSFDPATYEGSFTIAVAEFIGVLLLPALMERLQRLAPQIRIKNVSRVEHQLDELAEGNLDLAVHIARHHYSAEFSVTALGGAPPALLVREGHPLCSEPLTWDNVVRYPRVNFYIPDVDDLEVKHAGTLFSEYETQVQEVFETSHLYSALEVVKRTDCIMPGPFLATHPQLGEGITSFPVPLESEEDLQINFMLVSHQRSNNSLPHQWLCEQIVDLARNFSGAASV